MVENKKIISGKINNALSNDSHLYRGGGGNKNKNIWSPVLYTGSFKPNHATDHLTRNGRFQKNQQDFTAVLVYNIKTTMAEHNTILHTFRLSAKIKKLQSIHCCGVGEFAEQTKTDKQPKTKQRTIRWQILQIGPIEAIKPL